MKLDAISYKMLCGCLDDAEPLFILLERNNCSEYIKAISKLVNNNLLKCTLGSIVINPLSIEQILDNIEMNKSVPADIDKEFYDWNWQWDKSLVFSATTEGHKHAMKMFENAKKRTLKVIDKIKDKIDTDINFDVQIKPYDNFGNWVIVYLDNT